MSIFDDLRKKLTEGKTPIVGGLVGQFIQKTQPIVQNLTKAIQPQQVNWTAFAPTAAQAAQIRPYVQTSTGYTPKVGSTAYKALNLMSSVQPFAKSFLNYISPTNPKGFGNDVVQGGYLIPGAGAETVLQDVVGLTKSGGKLAQLGSNLIGQAGKIQLGVKINTNLADEGQKILSGLSKETRLSHLVNYSNELFKRGFTKLQIENLKANEAAAIFKKNLDPNQVFNPTINTAKQTFKSNAKPNAFAEENLNLFKNFFNKWIGKRQVAETTGTQFASKYKNIPANLGMELINYIENPSLPATPQIKELGQEIKNAFDALYVQANKAGIDVGYLKDYISHIWKESPAQVEQVFTQARTGFKFAKQRSVPTYAEGIKLGLHPVYTNPAEIIQSYATKLEQTKANIEFIKSLKGAGLISEGAVNGFIPIVAPGIKEGLYAPYKVATLINRVFSPEDTGTIGKVLDIGHQASSKIQDITLSGGVPGTAANAFTFAQMQKEILAGRIVSPIMSFIRSLDSNKTLKFFEDNVEQIKKMQARNVPVRSSFNVSNMIDKGTVKNLFGESIGQAWSKIVNEPTFGKFMPMLQINLFNDIEKTALKAGKDPKTAADIAAKAVSNFYGITNSGTEAMRTKLAKDTVGALFFAPRYRESMVNFWVNNIKAMKNPLALENRTNFKFNIGAILTLVGMDQINRAMNNGRSMMDNPTGKQDKLLIPLGDGYTLGIPYLSSIATIPRNLFGMASSVVQGDLPEALNSGKSFLSQAVRPPLDVLTNQNYFGSRIYNPGADDQLQDIGAYLAGAYSHPYMRAGIQAVQGKTPGYQIASQATELPLRYYKTENLYKYYSSSGKTKAQFVFEQLNKMKTPEEKNKKFNELVKNGTITKNSLSDIKQRFTDEKLGLTDKDRQIRNLKIVDMSRAYRIWDELNRFDTPAAKAAYYQKLVQGKVITEEVAAQLKFISRKQR